MTMIRSLLLLMATTPPLVVSFNNDAFSLSEYQKARALETAQSLDASRLHFQILFVDDDNAKGRIAEGLLARVAEHNDGVCVLFPASATIEASVNAPRDAAAPSGALAVCAALGLSADISTRMGTAFNLRYLDEYDLVVAMDDEIRSLILRSIPSDDQDYYAPKCRLLSEFLSPEFCNINHGKEASSLLLNMLELDLIERVEPFAEQIIDRSSNVFDDSSPEEAGAAMILASAGLTRFCLDTIDSQFKDAFQSLLQKNFANAEDVLNVHWDDADAQLRRCSSSVTGYFSPEQRKVFFERHLKDLQ